MGTVGEYGKRERLRAAAWKRVADDLPPRARAAGRFVGRRGVEVGPPVDYCLPASRAVCNLLPEVREDALGLFAELGIPWHSGIDGGPGNHLLSSQVQCVNALGQMVADPGRIVAAFSPELDIAEVLEVEPGRYLTFEYIGPTDGAVALTPTRARRRRKPAEVGVQTASASSSKAAATLSPGQASTPSS